MPCFPLLGNSHTSPFRLISYCIVLIVVILNNCQAIKLGKQVKSGHFIGKPPFFQLEEDPTNTSSQSKMTTPTSPTTFPKYMDMIGNTPLIDISSLVKNPKCPGFETI